MNGLALDIVAVAFLVLFLSVSMLWIGAMWEHKDCPPKTRPRTDRSRPATDRLLWDDEAWEFGDDPRDLIELERDISLHPSHRRNQNRG